MAREQERTGPDATIRPTAIQETWGFGLRILSNPHEAACHVCDPDDVPAAARTHGPDTRQACERWVLKHLVNEHGIVPVQDYEVSSGNEHWPS